MQPLSLKKTLLADGFIAYSYCYFIVEYYLLAKVVTSSG